MVEGARVSTLSLKAGKKKNFFRSNDDMKALRILAFMFIIVLISCDPIWSVAINNNKAFSDFFPFYRDKDTVMIDDKGRFLFQAQLKDYNDLKKDIEFIIPPNKYMICNNEPLISDTVKVILNVGKVKIGLRKY